MKRVFMRFCYFRLQVISPRDRIVEFIFPTAATFAQAKATIADHFHKDVVLQKYTVNADRLQTMLVSDQQSVSEVAEQSQLQLKVGGEEFQYDILKKKSTKDKVMQEVIKDSIKMQFIKHSQQSTIKAEQLKHLTYQAIQDSTIKEHLKQKIKETELAYQERKAIQFFKEQQWKIEEDKAIHRSLKFARVLMGLSVAQFVGLFYITYGLYGWDTGQPISYLLALGVDLLVVILVLRGMPATRQQMLAKSRLIEQVPYPKQLKKRVEELEERLNELSLKD